MGIAIVGGTGALGRVVTEELRARGHEVRVLSRRTARYRVDLTTGEGLSEALAGCAAVVDASNANPGSARKARATLVEGSKRLLAAERAAGVEHHVGVSIVGCDQVPLGYYRVKVAQEQVVRQGPVPWSMVRATQFHELLGGLFATAGRWRVLPIPRARLQPIACAEVAPIVADVVEGAPLRDVREVAGPEVLDAREMAHSWRVVTGRRALVLPLPLPGRIGRALRAGKLTAAEPAAQGRTSFARWLAEERG